MWLQRLARRAVRARRLEEAAVLARESLETCIVGLYCLHSGDAVTKLTAANNKAAGKIASYLTAQGLLSQDAMDSAVRVLGDQGRDLNLADVAVWLEQEKGIDIGRRLYQAYYVPLSHFFVHANALTLTKHVGPDNKLRRRPAFPWARRSAARMADGCTGLLAASIADASGQPATLLARYAAAHLDRLITPAVMMGSKGWLRSIPVHEIPAIFRAFSEFSRYVREEGHADSPEQRDVRVRQSFARLLQPLAPAVAAETFARAIDEFVAILLGLMAEQDDQPKDGGTRNHAEAS
jgi:hypothetical protein